MKEPPIDDNFKTRYPEIAQEWNYEKNSIPPEKYFPHSGKKVWWKCSRCGYEWETAICYRTQGHSCPACAHQKVVSGRNDLKTLYPDIAKYWDDNRNTLAANQVFPNTAKKYWWICEKGHSYLESPNTKVNMETGCPICSGHRLQAGANDLRTKFPLIASEWDKAKNEKSPEEVTSHSDYNAWWVCSNGHTYQAKVYNRTAEKATGCPYCAGRAVLKGYNDLASQRPEIAKQWHPTKNEGLTAADVAIGSNKKAWWLCPVCGNEWRTDIASRTLNNTSCPKCKKWFHTSKTEQILFYYIKKVFPDAINGYKLNGKAEIDIFIPSKNIGVEYDGERWHGEKKATADELKGKAIASSGIILYRVREPKCAKIDDRSTIILTPIPKADFSHLNGALGKLFECWQNRGICNFAPEIDVNKDILEIMASFAQNVAEKSLSEIAPDLVEEWDVKKNNGLKPEAVPAHSAIKAWWVCKKCGNSWKAVVSARVRGNGCPACAEKSRGKRVKEGHFHPGINDLITVAPQVAKEWDYSKNREGIETIVKGSHKKYWWICPNGHSYEAAVNNRVKGRGCPFCARKKKVE